MRCQIHDLCFQRLVNDLHRLGPRAIGELLIEIGRAHGIGDDLLDRLAVYAACPPTVLAAAGGHAFPPRPVYAIDGDGDPQPARGFG